ncbi:MAG: tRNA pseudouridine(55) synthase TruB, partial [Pseudomonadota bacterium]
MPRRRKGRLVDGVLLVDKPAGETSNRTLQRVRARFQARKAGHTGTLDPFATGLLPLCFGEATKFGTGLLDADKSYIASASWGTRTDTGDLDGEVVERTDLPMPTRETLAATLAARFSGTIEQVPPMYSALKHDGQRLHEIARAGGEVTREPRQVRIVDAAIIGAEEGQFSLAVTCSKGTYIRVLVEDLAKACGGLAHCIAL